MGRQEDGADGRPIEHQAPEPTSKAVKKKNQKNFVIEHPEEIGTGGEIGKTENNIAAIKLAKKLIKEGRPATTEEQAVLAKYVGWGGLKGVFEPWNRDLYTRFGSQLEILLEPDEYDAARQSGYR